MKNYPCALLGFIVAAASPAFAITAPYADTFQSTTSGNSPADWVTAGGATWSVVTAGSNQVYQAVGSSAAGSFSSTLSFSNITNSLSSFSISTSFKVTDLSNGAFVGIAAFGSTSGLGTNYLADVNAAGTVRIISQGTNADFVASSTPSLGVVFNTTSTYTMSLTGTYISGALNLSYTVSDGIGHTQTVTASDATPYTGTFFGIRLNNSVASDPFAAQFSNFNVTTSAVPEPSTTAALFGLGVLGASLVARRRRAR